MTPLSYQLYSSRGVAPLADTLRLLADTGYAQVEGYGALYADPAALGVLQSGLADTGLTMPTGHFSLEMVRDAPAYALKVAQTLGIRAIFVPYVAEDQRPTDTEGWAAFGADLARIAEPFWAAGHAFGWHNHDFEVVATEDGDLPLDLILAADPRLVLELDVAWALRGGQDPLPLISRHADRLLAAHVKDIAPEGGNADEDGWADVGQGTMDWSGLIGALMHEGCKYFVLEHDKPSDHARFARRSFAAVQAMTGTSR